MIDSIYEKGLSIYTEILCPSTMPCALPTCLPECLIVITMECWQLYKPYLRNSTNLLDSYISPEHGLPAKDSRLTVYSSLSLIKSKGVRYFTILLHLQLTIPRQGGVVVSILVYYKARRQRLHLTTPVLLRLPR